MFKRTKIVTFSNNQKPLAQSNTTTINDGPLEILDYKITEYKYLGTLFATNTTKIVKNVNNDYIFCRCWTNLMTASKLCPHSKANLQRASSCISWFHSISVKTEMVCRALLMCLLKSLQLFCPSLGEVRVIRVLFPEFTWLCNQATPSKLQVPEEEGYYCLKDSHSFQSIAISDPGPAVPPNPTLKSHYTEMRRSGSQSPI